MVHALLLCVRCELSFDVIDINNFVPLKDKTIAYFDLEKLKFPLKLRRWQKSDWFIPFGMNGKKKLSDYFSDNKFNIHQKEETWLLCSDDEIIWIVGERSDNRFKVNELTKKVFKIVQQ